VEEGDAVKPHSSNIRTVAASNCGFYQSERIDPFDLKQANFTFYNDFYTDGKDKRLLKFEFPIFKPSSGIVKCGTAQGSTSNQVARKDEVNNADNELLNLSITNLSQEDLNEEEEAMNAGDDDAYDDEDALLQSSAKHQTTNKDTSLLGLNSFFCLQVYLVKYSIGQDFFKVIYLRQK
jgi:hypothetical protein